MQSEKRLRGNTFCVDPDSGADSHESRQTRKWLQIRHSRPTKTPDANSARRPSGPPPPTPPPILQQTSQRPQRMDRLRLIFPRGQEVDHFPPSSTLPSLPLLLPHGLSYISLCTLRLSTTYEIQLSGKNTGDEVLCETKKHNIPASLEPYHFGTKRSTEDVISTALYSVSTHLEENNTYIRMLCVGFSSSFKTITLTALCNWILDFLTNRQFGLAVSPPSL